MDNYIYRLVSTKLGIVLNALPIVITTLFVCVLNIIRYKMFEILIVGLLIIVLYIEICNLIIKFCYCIISNNEIKFFWGKSLQIYSISIKDIKNATIKKATGNKLNYGKDEIVLSLDNKDIRLGLLECDIFMTNLQHAINSIN